MPLTDEERAQYLNPPSQLVGTWWWYLATPDNPRVYIVRDVVTEEPGRILMEEISWNGESLRPQASAVWLPLESVTGSFTSWWLLGNDWLAVFLRPNTPIINQVNPDLRGRITRVEGTTVSYEDENGTTGGTLSLWNFLNFWMQGVVVSDDGFDVPFPEIPEGTSAIEGKSNPFAPPPVMASTRFERDPIKD